MDQTPASAWPSFLIGAFLGGLPIWVALSLSLEMTYSSWTELGTVPLSLAIAVPIFCGLAAAIFKDRVIRFLETALDVTLPF